MHSHPARPTEPPTLRALRALLPRGLCSVYWVFSVGGCWEGQIVEAGFALSGPNAGPTLPEGGLRAGAILTVFPLRTAWGGLFFPVCREFPRLRLSYLVGHGRLVAWRDRSVMVILGRRRIFFLRF